MPISTLLQKNKPTADPNLQIREYIGNNDLILGNIFQHIHGDDLKRCRLVSRKWRDVSLPQFKLDMNLVFEKNNLRKVNDKKHRERTFESFFREFPNRYDVLPMESIKFVKTNSIVKDNKWTKNWMEAFGDEIKNLTIVVRHSRLQMMMNQLWAFRYNIFKYMYNVEHLSLIFTVSNEKNLPDDSPYEEFYGMPWINSYGKIAGIKLPFLKSLKYFVHERFSWSFDPSNEVSRCLFDIVTAAENLESLEMNMNPNHTATLLRVLPENLASIKVVSLVDWKCTYFQVIRSISKLADAGRLGKIKLHSFSLRCTCPHYEHVRVGDILLHSKILLVFLRSQKHCLQKLSLIHPPLPGYALDDDRHYPFRNILRGQEDFVFPKLENLENFILCSTYRNVAWISSGYENWNELFPKLKVLDYRYIIDPRNSTFSLFMKSKIIPNQSITQMTLAVNSFLPDADYPPSGDEETQSQIMWKLLKENFPNLKRVKVLGRKNKVSWIYETEINNISQFDQDDIPSSSENNNRQPIVEDENAIIELSDEEDAETEQDRSGWTEQDTYDTDSLGTVSWLRDLRNRLLFCPCCDPQDSN